MERCGEGDFETDGNPSGTMFHFSFPNGWGVGYESYTQMVQNKYSQASGTHDYCWWGNTSTACKWQLKSTMYDVFYLFDLTVINLVAGFGLGETKISLDQGEWESGDGRTLKKAEIQQYYLQLGYKFIPTFDVHLSYHNISTRSKGEIKYNDSGGGKTEEIDPGGTLLAIGIMFSF